MKEEIKTMMIDYSKLRNKFHDLRSRSTSFNTGIVLLKQRIIDETNHAEIISLMDDALTKVNDLWCLLKSEIENKG